MLMATMIGGGFSILGWIGITMILIYLVMGVVDPLTKSQQQQTFRYFDRSVLKRHFDNPREDNSYKTSDHDFMVLYRNMESGWDPGHPATVCPARDPKTHKRLNDGTYDVLCGNRRLAVAAEHMIDRVPCVVLENLTYEQELDVLLDHISVKGLNKREVIEAYRKLAVAGYTRERIAAKLDLTTRNGKLAVLKVDELADICQLPPTIQEEWLSDKPTSEKSIKPTGENLKKLTDAIAADRVGGHLGPVEEGPRFQATKATINSVKTEESDYGSKKALRAVATAEKLSAVIRNLFYILSGDTKGVPLGDALDVIRWMEQETLGTLSGIDRPAMVDKILGTDKAADPETTDSVVELVSVAVEPLPAPTPKRKK